MPAAKPTPRRATVAELETELARVEQFLLIAQRGNATARTELPSLIAGADTEGIAECRKRIKATAAEIVALTQEREFARAALGEANAQDLEDDNRARFVRICESVNSLVRQATNCENSGSAKVLAKVRAARQSVADELSAAGVPSDELRHLFTDMHIVRIFEWQQWLESDGALGRGPSLDSATQLRESGRASLRIQATEFRGVVLRTARQVLGDHFSEVST